MNDFDPYDWLTKLAKHQQEIAKQMCEIRKDLADQHIQLMKNKQKLCDLENRITACEAILVQSLK